MTTIMNLKITTTLRALGVKPHLIGYLYLHTAFGLCLQNKMFVFRVTKDLYPTIAKIHGTTASCVERGMRHAIGRSFLQADDKAKEKFFFNKSFKNGVPTNSEYIASVVEIMSIENEGASNEQC